MRKFSPFIIYGLLVISLAATENPPPRLAVVIVVDQMRADYLVRFRPYFVEGGFKRLLEGGADYPNCYYRHAITVTAPGHATILSGVHANVHGIVANDWLDPQTLLPGNAVEDKDASLVGLPPRLDRYANATFAAKAGRSPRNFLGTTVGDQLKARYGSAAKVISVSDKDRSAILLAGPKADGVYWTEEGAFVTSTYYRRELPDWVKEFNTDHNAAHYFGRTWDRLLDASIYETVQGSDDAPGEEVSAGLSATFPKKIIGTGNPSGGAFYAAFDRSPWSNEVVADMALRAIEAEDLGKDEIPDLLAVAFSQLDAAGHAYGPDSHEIMDSCLQLDRTLARFFTQLETKVGLEHCVIVLTSDHGVSPLSERIQATQGSEAAGRFDILPVWKRLAAELDAAFGPLPDDLTWWTSDTSAYGLRLNPAALRAREIPAARVDAELKAALLREPLFAAAYTREELTGQEPLDARGEMMRRSYFPARSPDVMYVLRPYYQSRKSGTSHGSPYDYDTHVPQLWFGAGVKPGVHDERVAVEDIAPTLADLLGVERPPEAKGRRLF